MYMFGKDLTLVLSADVELHKGMYSVFTGLQNLIPLNAEEEFNG